MLLSITQIVTLVALAVYLLVNRPSAKEIGRVVAGVGAVAWALIVLVQIVGV